MAQEGGRTLPVEELRKMLKKARNRRHWEARNAAEAAQAREQEDEEEAEEETEEDVEEDWEDVEDDAEGGNVQEVEEDTGMEIATDAMARMDMERNPWQGKLVNRTK